MTLITLSQLLAIRLNVAVAEHLKSLGLFDVMALPVELKPLYELRTDPTKFLRVVFEMLDQNFRSANALTFEQFSAQITDDETYGELWEAFAKEITDFFRGPMRPVIATLFEMLELAEAERVADLMATIQASLPPSEPNSLGDLSGGLPESPESMPDLSHCDSLTIWPPAVAAMNGDDSPASCP